MMSGDNWIVRDDQLLAGDRVVSINEFKQESYAAHFKSLFQKGSIMSKLKGTNDNGYRVNLEVPKNATSSTFSLGQIVPKTGKEELMLSIGTQKPVVNTARNLVTVAIPDWGTMFTKAVPKLTQMDEHALGMKLEYQCLKPGKHDVTITFRLSPFSAVDGKLDMNKMKTKDKVFYQIAFTFVKECGEVIHSVMERGVPGLYVSSSLTDSKHDVIVNGEATPAFKLNSLPGDSGAMLGPTNLFIVDEGIQTYSFGVDYVSLPGARRFIDIASASVISQNPILTANVIGHASRRHRITAFTPLQKLSVNMVCNESGADSIVTVILNIHESAVAPRFSFIKRCGILDMVAAAGVTKCDGGICQLSMGTTSKASDVMFNGITTEPFLLRIKEDKDRKVYTVSNTTDIAEFFVNIRNPEFFEIDAVDVISPESEPYLVPHIIDPFAWTAVKLNQESGELSLKVGFTCLKTGTGPVTLLIHAEEKVSIVFHKECFVPEPEAPPVTDQESLLNSLRPVVDPVPVPKTIPGLTVALTTSANNISALAVSHGITHADYTPWKAQTPLKVNSATHFITFFVLVMKPNTEAELSITNNVRFSYPTVSIFQPSIVDAKIAGQGANGANLSPLEDYSVLSMSLHCKTRGTSWIKVSLPIISNSKEEYVTVVNGIPQRPRAHRDEAHIDFYFQKECFLGADESSIENYDMTSSSGLGGVGMLGLSIGMKPKTSHIVQDGFPAPSYYGQKNLENPYWNRIKIAESQGALSLFISYFLPNHERSHDDLLIPSTISLGIPAVVSHSAAASPTLSGSAAGGTLLKFGEEGAELTVTFNCNFKDLVPVTVTIPVEPTGTIVFTIPKMCGGETVNRGAQTPGLQVALVQEMCIDVAGDVSAQATGLKEDGTGVIVKNSKLCKLSPRSIMKDGVAEDEFSSYKPLSSPHYVVSGSEATTSFVLRRTTSVERKQHPVFGSDPIIQCLRPICKPTLTHTLALDTSQYKDVADPKYNGFSIPEAVLAPGIDPIVIADKLKRISITYHCLYPGTSPVQLTIPLYPDVSISIMFMKKCTGDSLLSTVETSGSIGVIGNSWDRHDETTGVVDPLALNPFMNHQKNLLPGLRPSDVYRTALMCTLDVTTYNPKEHPQEIGNVVYQGVPRKEYRASSAEDDVLDEVVSYKTVKDAKYVLQLENKAKTVDNTYYSWNYWQSWLYKTGQQRGGFDDTLTQEELSLVSDIDPNRQYAIIPPSVKDTRFYFTVNPDEVSFQPFAAPFVKTLANSLGQTIVTALVSGTVKHGANITSISFEGGAPKIENSPLPQVYHKDAYIDVSFKCLKDGYTSALVVVPLIPSALGSVSWRVIKLCNGVKPAKTWLMVLVQYSYLLLLGIPILILLCITCIRSKVCYNIKERFLDWKHGDTTFMEQLQPTNKYAGLGADEATDVESTSLQTDVEMDIIVHDEEHTNKKKVTFNTHDMVLPHDKVLTLSDTEE